MLLLVCSHRPFTRPTTSTTIGVRWSVFVLQQQHGLEVLVVVERVESMSLKFLLRRNVGGRKYSPISTDIFDRWVSKAISFEMLK